MPSPTQVIDAATFVSGGDVSFAAGEHVVIDFSNVSSLVIPGNLSNLGVLYALSNNPESVGISISANNIFNGQGAVISTVLPAAGIPGYANAVGNLSLMLNAVENIVNQGAITSAGGLSMTAGNSIFNSISPGAGPAPVIQAVQNVDLSGLSIVNQGLIASIAANVNAATASLTNSAAMSAGSGSVAIQNLLGSSLSIENTLGSILARDQVRFATTAPDVSTLSGLSGKGALLFSGGAIDADKISFDSPAGLISVMADRIDGAVSVSGGSARLAVRVGNLQLQDMSLSGDPIIANSGGDVFLPNSLVFRGQDLAVLASGNVFQINHDSLLNIDLSAPDSSSDGGDLTIVAGYDFDIDTAGAQQQFDSPTPRFAISGPSGTGGSIVLNNVSFNTSAIDGNAGNITIVAHSGSDPDVYRSSGVMSLSGQSAGVSDIDATSENGNGGNVLIVAHSDNIRQAGPFGGMVGGTDESIILPAGFHHESGRSDLELSINTSSLNAAAGSVEIYASEPRIEGGVLEFEDGNNVGLGRLTPTRTVDGQLVVPETTFQESFSQEFLAGNLRFRGQITSLGPAGNPVVSIGGRNVSIRTDVLVGFDTEFRSIESGGDLYLYGQDSLHLGSGLYSAGQSNLSEDPFDQGSFWNLVDSSSLVKSGGVSISAEQLQVNPAARFLSNFGDVHFQFDRLFQNPDPELHTEILQAGLIVARGGSVHVVSAESTLRVFGTIVARAVDEAVPFRGGGIEIGVENLPAGDLAALLAMQPLNLPLLASNVFREGRDVRTEGRFVDESAGLGDFVQVYREPSSNWAALQLNGSVVANEAEFSFNNGAIILHAGSGMLNVSAAEFIVAAPLSDSAPPPPPPPPPPVLPDRPDLPAVPEEAVTLSANFNLGSADAFLAANTLLEAGQTVQLQQGVTVVLIEHTDLLTPAQYLAAMQVISGGAQTLVLGDGGATQGAAVGGSFSISASFAAKLAGLVIPADVIALQNAAEVSAVDFGGNLINFGSFYLYSSSPSVEEVNLIADNLQNHPGAVISTILPAVLPPGAVAATSELSLKIDVGAQLINSGLLSSSSKLTISAGESVVNALPAGVVAAPPAVVAFDQLLVSADVVLNLGAMQSISGGVGLKVNELANLALISAAGGDVSVENISGRSLNINNSLGMLQASNQISIAVTTILSTFGVQQQAPSLTVFGGTLSAQSIYFSNSAGAVGAGVDAISGVVSADAGNLSVVSGGSLLRLGELTVNGGVFLANHEGGLDLSGLFAVSGGFSSGGGEIVLLSGGSISGFGAAGQIDSLGPDSSGNITLGAGLTFQVNAAAPQEFLLDLDAACTHCLPTFAITGLGAPDGVVDLPGVTIVTGGGDLIALAAADVALGPVASVGSDLLDSGSVRLVAGLAGVGLLLLDSINSSATGVGRAGGLVDLSAADSVLVSGIVDASSLSGSAGDVGIVSSNGSVAVNSLGASTVTAINTSSAGSVGNRAGAVRVESPQGSLLVNGIVNSSAGGQAASGQIDFSGQNVTVLAAIVATASSGDGAAVSITAAESIVLDDVISSGGTGAPAASGSGGLVAVSAGLLGAGSVTTGDLTTIGSGAGRAGGLVVVQAPGSVTLGNVNTSGMSGASGGNVTLSMGLLPNDSPDLTSGTVITSGNPAGVVEIIPVDLRALDAVDDMVRKLEALGNAIKSLSARPFLEIPFSAVRGLTGSQFSLLERYYGQQLLEILLQPDALSNFGSQIGEINLSLAELPGDRSAALVDLGRLQDIQSLSRQQVALQRDIDSESSKLQTLQIRLESEFGKPFLDQDLSTTQGLLVSRSRGLSSLVTLQVTILDLQLDQLDIQLLRAPAEFTAINQSRSEITDTKAQIQDKSVADQNELQLQLAHLNTFAIPLQQNLKLQSKVSEKIQQVQNQIDLQSTFQPSLWSDWNSTQELHLLIDRVGEQINLTDLQLQQIEIEQLNAPLVGANSSDLAQSRADLLSRRDGLVDSLNELRSKLSDATYGKQQLPPPPPRPEEGPRENPLIKLLSELRGQIIPDLTRRLDGNAEQLDFISNLPQVEHEFEVQLANSINGRVPFIPAEKNYQTIELPSGDERTDIGKVVNQARFMLDTSMATFNFSEKTAASGALYNLEKSKLETENGGLQFQEALLEGKILQIGGQIGDLQQQQSALLDQLSQERSTITTELSALRGQLQTLTAGSPSEGAVLTEIAELREEVDIKQRLLDGIARKESVSKVEQQSKVNDLVKERTRLSGELQDVRTKLAEGEGKLQALTNNASTIDREFVESGLAYLKLVLENTETFYQVKRTDIDSRIVGLVEVPGPPQQAAPAIEISTEVTEVDPTYSISVHYRAEYHFEAFHFGDAIVQGPAYTVFFPDGHEESRDSLIVLLRLTSITQEGSDFSTPHNTYTDSQYNFSTFFDEFASSLPKDLSTLPADLAAKLAELPGLAQTPKLLVPIVQEVNSDQLGQYQQSALRLGQSNLANALKDGTPVEQALAIRSVDKLVQAKALADASIQANAIAVARGAANLAQGVKDVLTALQGTVGGATSGQDLQNQLLATRAELLNLREGDISDEQLSILNAQLGIVNNLLSGAIGLATLQNAGFESLRKSLSEFLAGEVEMAGDVIGKLNAANSFDEAQSALNFSDSALVNYGNKISQYAGLSVNDGIAIDQRANTLQQFKQTQIAFDKILWNSSLELMAARDGIKGPLVGGWSEIFNLDEFAAGIGFPPSLAGRLEPGFAERYRSNALTENDKEVMNEALPFLLEKAKPLMLKEVAVTAHNQNALVAANEQLNASKQSGLRVWLGQALDSGFDFAQSIVDWGLQNMSPLSTALQQAPEGFSPTGVLLEQAGFYGSSVSERREDAVNFRKEFLGDVHLEIEKIGNRLANAGSDSEFARIYFSEFLYQQNLGDRTVSSINSVDLKAYQTLKAGADAFVNTTVSIASAGYGSAVFSAVRGAGLGLVPAVSMSLATAATMQGSATGLYVGIDSIGHNSYDAAVKEMSTAYLSGFKQGFLNQAGNLLAMPFTGPLTAGLSNYTGQLSGQYLGGFLDAGLSNALSEAISVTSAYAQGKIVPGLTLGDVLLNNVTQAFTDGMKTHALFGAINIGGSGLIKGLNGGENWSFSKPGETATSVINSEQRLDRLVGADLATLNPSQTELRLARFVTQDKLALQNSSADTVVSPLSRAELGSGEGVILPQAYESSPSANASRLDMPTASLKRTTINQELSVLQSEAKQLASQLSNLEKQRDLTQAFIDAPTTSAEQKSELSSKLTELNTKVASKVEQIVLNDKSVRLMQAELKSANADLASAIETRIGQLQEPLSKVGEQIDSLDKQLDDFSGKTDLPKELLEIKQSLEQQLSLAESQYNQLSDQIRDSSEMRTLKTALADAMGFYPEGEYFLSDTGQKIVVRGGANKQSVSVETIDEIRSILGSHGLRPAEIVFEAATENNKSINGEFNENHMRITIVDKGDRGTRTYTFDHESGHLYDSSVISRLPAEVQNGLSQSYKESVSGAKDQLAEKLGLGNGNSAEFNAFKDELFSDTYHQVDLNSTKLEKALYLLSRDEVFGELLKLNTIKERILADGGAEPTFQSLLAEYTTGPRKTYLEGFGQLYETLGTLVKEHSNLREASLPSPESRANLDSISLLKALFPNSNVSEEMIAQQVLLQKGEVPNSPAVLSRAEQSFASETGAQEGIGVAKTESPALSQRQQGLLAGPIEAKELIAGNTSGIQTFFAVQQSPDSGPKVVIARVANDGASVPGGENFAERVTFEQAAHQINQMLGFDSPYPAAVVREVTMPDGSTAQAMVQEMAGSKSLSQYVSRPPSSKVEAKAFDVVFEQALVERLIYGDSDVHGANFMVSGRGESVKVSNIDLGRGFSQETEPRWFLPEGGVSPDSAEGQIMMYSGKSISSVTQSKVTSFVQQIKSVEGTETLKGLGLSDAQIKGVVGRAQFFAETGRFPEMESMPVPSEASAIPPVAAPDNTPFKSEAIDSDNTLVPVSFKQSVPAVAAQRVDKIRLPGATLVKAPDTRMSLAAMGAIRLKSGEVCISATKPSVVLDDGVRVNLAPGAIVLVGKNQNAFTVSVLHDCGPGQVNVRKGSSLVSLSTGEELILHRKRIDSESLAGHRRIVSSTMPGGEIATLSEVSIPQLLTVSPALQAMRRSNQRFERSVLEKVTKTAACVQVVTGGHGPYSAAVGK